MRFTMSIANTFNITIQVLREQGGLVLNDTSTPPISTAYELIQSESDLAHMMAQEMGVDISGLTPSDVTYSMWRRVVINGVLEKLYLMRDRGGTEGSDRYRALHERAVEELRRRTAVYAPRAPGVRVSSAREIRERYLRDSMNTDWFRSTAGRIAHRRN